MNMSKVYKLPIDLKERLLEDFFNEINIPPLKVTIYILPTALLRGACADPF